MMTSQITPPLFPYDVILRDYEKAALPKPTLVRLSKVVTLDAKLITKKLGKLSEYDRETVKREFSKLFDLR